MSQKSKIIAVFGALLIIAGTLVGVSVANDQSKKSAESSQVSEQKKEASEVSYQGVEGKTALDLLKSSHTVETKTYDGLGELVTTIDGVAPDSKHFWSFYVNGKMAEVGAGQYNTKAGETITWKLDAIQ